MQSDCAAAAMFAVTSSFLFRPAVPCTLLVPASRVEWTWKPAARGSSPKPYIGSHAHARMVPGFVDGRIAARNLGTGRMPARQTRIHIQP